MDLKDSSQLGACPTRPFAAKTEVFSGSYAPVNEEHSGVEYSSFLSAQNEPISLPCKEQGPQQSKTQVVQSSEPTESDDDEIYYLSEKYPFFDVVLTKTQVNPTCQLHLPVKIVHELPRAKVPVVLRHGGKNWNSTYIGDSTSQRFEHSTWRNFVVDNGLKEGDALVFELKECSNTNIKFKVHILKCDLPPELLAKFKPRGTLDNPIPVD
ncbi:hypothetical protein ACJIZ3_007625 [Penstemon smallii]|uniref:TF-B3 domain-containing protein n=1 Tax=Penstemon smallii TaxID=265156 RepID=A0ABD3T7I0_9LAMI